MSATVMHGHAGRRLAGALGEFGGAVHFQRHQLLERQCGQVGVLRRGGMVGVIGGGVARGRQRQQQGQRGQRTARRTRDFVSHS
jgi:hypothetical protein